MAHTDTLVAPAVSYPDLTLSDRCQSASCGAQAFVRVEIPVTSSPAPLDVLYCSHHYNRHSAGLAGAGARVVHDERAKINSKPTDPSDSQGF